MSNRVADRTGLSHTLRHTGPRRRPYRVVDCLSHGVAYRLAYDFANRIACHLAETASPN